MCQFTGFFIYENWLFSVRATLTSHVLLPLGKSFFETKFPCTRVALNEKLRDVLSDEFHVLSEHGRRISLGSSRRYFFILTTNF